MLRSRISVQSPTLPLSHSWLTFCFRLTLPDTCCSYLISCETIAGVWLQDYQMVIHINKIHHPSSTLSWQVSINWLQGHFVINLSLWCSIGRIVGTFRCALAQGRVGTSSFHCVCDLPEALWWTNLFLLPNIHSPYLDNRTLILLWRPTIFHFHYHSKCIQHVGTWSKPDKLNSLWHLTIKLSGSRSEIGSDLLIMRPEPRGAYPLVFTT